MRAGPCPDYVQISHRPGKKKMGSLQWAIGPLSVFNCSQHTCRQATTMRTPFRREIPQRFVHLIPSVRKIRAFPHGPWVVVLTYTGARVFPVVIIGNKKKKRSVCLLVWVWYLFFFVLSAHIVVKGLFHLSQKDRTPWLRFPLEYCRSRTWDQFVLGDMRYR